LLLDLAWPRQKKNMRVLLAVTLLTLPDPQRCAEIGVDHRGGQQQAATFAEALSAGQAALAKRKLASAAQNFKHAKLLDPSHALGCVMMGVVLGEMGDLEKSELEYVAALKLEQTAGPYLQAIHFNLGLCRYKFAQHLDSRRSAAAFPKFDEAEGSFRDSIAAKPDHAESYQHLALLFKLRGKIEDARSYMQQAVALAPTDSNLLLQAAQFYHQSGLVEQAATAYQAVIALKPDSADLRAGLGGLLLQAQRIKEAEVELLGAFKLNPLSSRVANNLAIVHHDRPQEMIHYYQTAIAIDPRKTDSMFNLAIALADQEQYANATAVYRRYLEIQRQQTEGSHFWKPKPAAYKEKLGLAVLQSYQAEIEAAGGEVANAADSWLQMGLTKMQIALLIGHPDGHLDIDPYKNLVEDATQDVRTAIKLGIHDRATTSLLHYLGVWHQLNNRYETFKWPLLTANECEEVLARVTQGDYDDLKESIDGIATKAYQYQIVGSRTHTAHPNAQAILAYLQPLLKLRLKDSFLSSIPELDLKLESLHMCEMFARRYVPSFYYSSN
jgi:Tfp pilus assembly protein PilF